MMKPPEPAPRLVPERGNDLCSCRQPLEITIKGIPWSRINPMPNQRKLAKQRRCPVSPKHTILPQASVSFYIVKRDRPGWEVHLVVDRLNVKCQIGLGEAKVQAIQRLDPHLIHIHRAQPLVAVPDAPSA